MTGTNYIEVYAEVDETCASVGSEVCVMIQQGIPGVAGIVLMPLPYVDNDAAIADGGLSGWVYALDFPNNYDLPGGLLKLLPSLIFVLFSFCMTAQPVKSSGWSYSNGVPSWTPNENTAGEFAGDTTTGYIYQWHRTAGPSNLGGWLRIGQGIDVRVDAIPPSYAPFRNQSWFVVNALNELYHYSGTGTTWNCMNCGLVVTVFTDATLAGDGSSGNPLSIAQQSATTSQVLQWTGATWEPTNGNPYVFVTTGATITTDVNEILVGTVLADIVFGLPTCDATTDTKHFKFVRNGTDAFSVTIDGAGSQAFYDGTLSKISYGKLSIDCTCRFSAGTGTWFFDNF